MSGTIGKKNSTLKKEQVRESKLLTQGVKLIKFWHEASAGDKSISFGSLSLPTELSNNGFSNPNSAEILSANLSYYQENVTVISSLNGELMLGLTFLVNSNGVKFLNDYEAVEGEIFEVTYKNEVVSGNNIVDVRPLSSTGTMTAGNTTYNVGEAFRINAYPGSQIGEVMVFVDGVLQFRNTNNATAAPAADGNYQEVQSSGGYGISIEFNDSFADDVNIIVTSRGMIAERPNISMMQNIDTLAGQVDKIVEVLSDTAGVPESTFQTSPNNVDLKAFGDIVQALLGAEVPIITEWADFTPSTQGIGTPTINYAQWRQVRDSIEIIINLTTGTVTADEYQLGLPNSYAVASSINTATQVGDIQYAALTAHHLIALATGGDTYLNVSYRSTSSANITTPENGSTIFSNSEQQFIRATIPIEGLQGTQTLRQQLGL